MMMKSTLNQTRRWLSLVVALTLCTILLSSCAEPNNDPTISSLQAEENSVTPSGSCEVECVASDPDGDELSYQWSAARGNISGQGSSVSWTTPNSCGSYVITVTVADSRGGEVNEELEIKVIKPG